MGQQQLLLLVLGIVIVGLAIVAGINAFEQNQERSAQDAITQEAFRYATDAKAWYLSPTAFGGGGGDPAQLSSMTWDDLGVTSSGSIVDTPWGTITLVQGNPLGLNVAINSGGTDNNADTPFGCITLDPGDTEGDGQEISFDETSC